MGSMASNLLFPFKVGKGITARVLFGWNNESFEGTKITAGSPPPITMESVIPSVFNNLPMKEVIQTIFRKDDRINRLSDEAIIKICRQLEFWYTDGDVTTPNEMASLCEQLVDQSTWYHDKSIKVPTTRFGKTELQIPRLTCGGMRLQQTWLPDNLPILPPKRETVLSAPPQSNLKVCIRKCLQIGMNHFETARMYGSSEYQIVDALVEMMDNGEIKREDFIFQTKILPGTKDKFDKAWNATWENVKGLQYIDLFSFHVIHKETEDLVQNYEFIQQQKKEGKVRFIGFSTHGTSEQIMNLINTEKYDYINIHYHFIGSYHGSGTPDTMGGEGNLQCVKRAKQLDMGVFQISPIDKGGHLYYPSKDFVKLVGKDMTPIAFALLYAWRKCDMDTSSIGIGRTSDLDEVMGAIKLMTRSASGEIDLDGMLDAAIDRLNSKREEILGKEWMEKGLLNLPTCCDEVTDGVFVGHILWLHNLLFGFGLYDYARARYDSFGSTKWDKKKSFEENEKNMSPGNLGRGFDKDVDLTKALKNHYNPQLAMKKLKETHEYLSIQDSKSNNELEELGWKRGYNLTTWMDMCGQLDSRAIFKVILQTLTGGRMGMIGMGPGDTFRAEADALRKSLS